MLLFCLPSIFPFLLFIFLTLNGTFSAFALYPAVVWPSTAASTKKANSTLNQKQLFSSQPDQLRLANAILNRPSKRSRGGKSSSTYHKSLPSRMYLFWGIYFFFFSTVKRNPGGRHCWHKEQNTSNHLLFPPVTPQAPPLPFPPLLSPPHAILFSVRHTSLCYI